MLDPGHTDETHDEHNADCNGDLATIARTSQSDVLELMYYIRQPKILPKYTFLQEQCLVFLRDNVSAREDNVLRQDRKASSERLSAQSLALGMVSTR
jgi:hypothetical protein